jgi:hypothetical protein
MISGKLVILGGKLLILGWINGYFLIFVIMINMVYDLTH